MKVVILAGGLGTRLSEETGIRPKPMLEIGERPILWHIMKIYSHFGFNEFIICAGYKGYIIKEYFANYVLHNTSVTFDLKQNKIEYHEQDIEPWKVTVVDTGAQTSTGGRIKQIQKYVGNEPFLLTYGDGVANIDLSALIASHRKAGKQATITGVQPFGRFGLLQIEANGLVSNFNEKPRGDGNWINGGFFVLEPSVFDLIQSNTTVWEREPLELLAHREQLNCYRHAGFWRPMDTLKDKADLNELWSTNKAEWKIW
jgi:glucose-1-phosphate cytidylyltransferase